MLTFRKAALLVLMFKSMDWLAAYFLAIELEGNEVWQGALMLIAAWCAFWGLIWGLTGLLETMAFRQPDPFDAEED